MVRGRPRKTDPDCALASAMQVFWTKGFEGTSLADLVEATGMAKPSLYATFGDKEALYTKALTRYMEGVGDEILGRIGSDDRPIRAVMRSYLEDVADRATDRTGPCGCFVVNSIVDAENLPEQTRRMMDLAKEKRSAIMVQVFDKAKARGDLPSSSSSMALADYFWGQTLAIALMARSGESRDSIGRFIDLALAVLGPEPVSG
ncbi:MAG: TetR/AcrR family transcriptional regulator [Alphaproteobacteria bacterium]|nr:TetR/AcrR family transcriptional regulator [Alphaproteobacteria bacterium]